MTLSSYEFWLIDLSKIFPICKVSLKLIYLTEWIYTLLELGPSWAPVHIADLSEMISIQDKEKDLSDLRSFFIGELGYENLESLGYTQGKAET